MAKRLKFKCWNCECGREYSLLIQLEGKPKFTVECPFCGKTGIVDLDTYRDKSVKVFKEASSDNNQIAATLNLPDVIPTLQSQN